ncbi:MAG: DNA-binding protein WhiA, partial [Thermoleophilia bacterium]|nr:DNA-binding protein WhiA [Thermoleophilia bacterium]
RQRGAVQDLLTVIGAESAALDVAEDDVVRSARADANRRANFDTANLSRQVLASRSQLQAIAALHDAGALTSLPVVLRSTAQLRLDNPELTLAELSIMANVARPTLAARLRRLIAESEALG